MERCGVSTELSLHFIQWTRNSHFIHSFILFIYLMSSLEFVVVVIVVVLVSEA